MKDFVGEDRLKLCRGCQEYKSPGWFNYKNREKGELHSRCRECTNKKVREWRETNPDKERASQKDYYERHKEHLNKLRREHYYENREEELQKKKQYYIENRDCILEYKKLYTEKNKKKIRERNKQYQKENRDIINERNRLRYMYDPNFKLRCSMKEMVRKVLKGLEKREDTQSLLGYKSEDLRKRLECQFQPGMVWENYGTIWNIDHKIPVNYFLKKGETRPHVINALSNLQPMWASENFSKQDDINYEPICY